MNKGASNSQDQWLIKSANRVMGPFKLTEVVTGLQLKHFTVMDEISAPFGRWVLVRDEQALQGAVKEIRNRSDSYENTATLTQTMTSSMSLSMSELALSEAPPPIPGGVDPKTLKNSRLKSQIEKHKARRLTFFLLFLLLALGGGYLFTTKKKVKEASLETLAQAKQFKAQGFYEKQFALLTKLRSQDRSLPQVDLDMGIYQIAVQNQNVTGRKTIERVLSQLSTKELESEAHSAMALSYLKEGDLKNANESLEKALAANPKDIAARINKGVLEFKRGNLDDAESFFEELGQLAQTDGVILLSQAVVALEKSRTGGSPRLFGDVLGNAINDYLKTHFVFQQEAYVVRAYNLAVSGKPLALRRNAILDLLNSDLESGQGHPLPLLVDRSLLNWSRLEDYCKSTIEQEPYDLLNRSFMAYCHFKAGKINEAKSLILKAEAESPRHPHVAGIKAFIWRSMGDDAIAKASMGIALSEKSIVSAWLMRAKYCEVEKNFVCMKEALDKVFLNSARSLPFYSGMARWHSLRGDKKGALDWVAQGQTLAPQYLPFLELKNSLQ